MAAALRSALAGLREQVDHDPPVPPQPVQIFLPLRLDCFHASVWFLLCSSSLATAWLCSSDPSHSHAPRQPRPGQAKSERGRCVSGSAGPIRAACSRVGGGSAPFAFAHAARSAVSTAARFANAKFVALYTGSDVRQDLRASDRIVAMGLYAATTILPGEEIFVHYGTKSYENLRIGYTPGAPAALSKE